MSRAKVNIQRHWNRRPCGPNEEPATGTVDYFTRIEEHRYADYVPWLPRVMGFTDVPGRRLLEIGFGQGTDLIQFAQGGARCTGIDLTATHIALTKKRFAQQGLEIVLLRGDAERLPFDDDSFDIVYSYGVLHHTPRFESALREVRRILKPGGEARIMVYARHSLFHAYVLLQSLLRLQLPRYGYRACLSHWCEGTDWDNPVPVRLFSKREVAGRFREADFAPIRISKHLLTRGNLPLIGSMLTESALERLARLIGWNLIVHAGKPGARSN